MKAMRGHIDEMREIEQKAKKKREAELKKRDKELEQIDKEKRE